jgi:hypothetical protein
MFASWTKVVAFSEASPRLTGHAWAPIPGRAAGGDLTAKLAQAAGLSNGYTPATLANGSLPD